MSLLPFPTNQWIAALTEAFWREATLAQIEKDFALQAIPLKFDTNFDESADFMTYFSAKLEALALVHHPRFISLLYQLDLPEKKISGTIANSEPDKIYSILAEVITRQCFRKVWWRQQMK